jgi:hypothetical protein
MALILTTLAKARQIRFVTDENLKEALDRRVRKIAKEEEPMERISNLVR